METPIGASRCLGLPRGWWGFIRPVAVWTCATRKSIKRTGAEAPGSDASFRLPPSMPGQVIRQQASQQRCIRPACSRFEAGANPGS